MTSAWTEIARRAAEAKGEDRGLDLEVAFSAGELQRDRAYGERYLSEVVERYTESLDAVLALIKEKLPGASFTLWSPHFVAKVGRDRKWGESAGATAPLALLSAFALAMAEQGGAET